MNRGLRSTSYLLAWVAGLVLLLSGCASTRPEPVLLAPAADITVTYTEINDSAGVDPQIEEIVMPYRTELTARTSEVIGRATQALTKAQPEGALGNFAADAMRTVAAEALGEPVDIAVTNNGGLRVPIPEGPITVGALFELMPFENALVLLTLSGTQVDSLAGQIARIGGEPVAGLTFAIEEPSRRAVDVRVNGEPVDPGRLYHVVTSDYLADIGGGLPVLSEYRERVDVGVTLRDAFITYTRQTGVIEPRLEGRITVVTEAETP